MDDLITIIIPVYNVEKYLPKCIDSIINQSYKNLEIILVNNKSTDSSLNICKNYEKMDTRIKVINTDKKGVSYARNIGIKEANGKYLTFVDADDYLDLNFCKIMLQNLIRTNSDCVACGYNRVYENREERIINNGLQELSNIEFLEKILEVQSGLGFCHMKLWKKEIVDISKVKFNENIIVAEDALFCIQISESISKLFIVNEALYNYRFNEQSVVRKYDSNYANKYLKAMIETKKYIQSKYNDELMLKKLSNYIVYHVLLIIVNYCFNPNNGNNTIEQFKLLKMICEIDEFNKAIKKCNYEGVSLTRKITIFTIKYKLYFVTMLIAKIRQLQFRK